MSAIAPYRESRLKAATSRRTTLTRAALAFFLATLHCAAHAADPATSQSVLVLFSNGRPLPGITAIDATLRQVVPQVLGHPVEIFDEFLDVEHFADAIDAEKMADFLHLKYRKLNVGVIVVAGPEALRFALGYRDRIVPNAPVVHINVSREDLPASGVPPDVLGWTVDLDPTATLELAERLHPHATRLILVTGASGTDRALERRIRLAVAGLKGPMQVTLLAGLPTTEVLRQLRALTDDAIVYTPGYYVDGSGNVTTPRQAVEQMAPVSGAPIYDVYDPHLGSGIVGGYMATFEDQTKHAGETVAALLAGTAPAAIPTGTMRNTFMVDWRQLRRWSIDEAGLPAGTVIRFREPTAWDKYRAEISVGVAIVLIQSALIAALLLQLVRRRRAEDASSALAGRLLTAHEDERRRLARDLHDDVTQRLARLAIDAGRMERDAAPGQDAAAARAVREGLIGLSEDVHALSYRLHPSVLDDLGLAEGLKTECGRLSQQDAIVVNVELGEMPSKLAREPSLCIFRVAQEALRNVVRHAGASTVSLSLVRDGRGLKLTVRDDGRGFDPASAGEHPSLGRVSMIERVRQLGGKLRIDSAPGRGTTVTAWVPIEEVAA